MTLADQISNLRRGASGTNPDGPGAPAKPREKRKRVSPWQYLKEIYQELRKVNWPKRQQVYRGTVQVVVFSAVLAAILGGLDLAFQEGLDRLLRRELENVQIDTPGSTPGATPGSVPDLQTIPGGTEGQPLQLPEGIPPPPGFEGAVETIPGDTEAPSNP